MERHSRALGSKMVLRFICFLPSSAKGIVIAQCEVESTTNEIPVVKQLLEPLAIQGSVVTLDALHTQKSTAEFLVKERALIIFYRKR